MLILLGPPPPPPLSSQQLTLGLGSFQSQIFKWELEIWSPAVRPLALNFKAQYGHHGRIALLKFTQHSLRTLAQSLDAVRKRGKTHLTTSHQHFGCTRNISWTDVSVMTAICLLTSEMIAICLLTMPLWFLVEDKPHFLLRQSIICLEYTQQKSRMRCFRISEP